MPAILIDILEEHAEELEFLWGQRRSAWRSPQHDLRSLSHLDQRIEAHFDALLTAGEPAQTYLEKWFAVDDPVQVFLGAYGMLRADPQKACPKILDAMHQAEGPRLWALRQALRTGVVAPIRSRLQQALTSSPAPVAVAVAEILASHGHLEMTTEQFNKFAKHEQAPVRHGAWRTAARTTIPRKSEQYEAGLRDEETGVRREAMTAATWGKHAGLLEFCRKTAGQPPSGQDGGSRWDAIQLLAILGKPTELPRLLALAKGPEANVRCFQALGAFGHPGSMDTILAAMKNQNPRIAVAAAAAFAKITGRNIDSDQRVPLPPEDGSTPDNFEKEFLDEAKLPNVKLAGDLWQKISADFAKGTRWCRGLDLSKPAPPEVLARLDMESRLETYMRMRFEGAWQGSLATLEKFPQKMGG
jgi:uncharacterized protein (TIGR02270 family)